MTPHLRHTWPSQNDTLGDLPPRLCGCVPVWISKTKRVQNQTTRPLHNPHPPASPDLGPRQPHQNKTSPKMSEMGLPTNTQVTSMEPSECASPARVASSPSAAAVAATTPAGAGVAANEATPAAKEEESKAADSATDEEAAPLKAKKTKKEKKEKKPKKQSFKNLMKDAMSSSRSEAQKQADYVAKLSRAMGGGSFAKMDQL